LFERQSRGRHKNKKDDNVIDEEMNWQGTNSLHRSISVNKDFTNCASTTTIGNIDVCKVQSNETTTHSISDIGNDTEMEIEKE